MSRVHFLVLLLFAAIAFFWNNPTWAARSELISETTAARHGLTRSWFTQVELDPARGRLQTLVLHDGVLYAQTDKAVVQAIDAETGKTLWSKQAGRPQHPTMAPGVNRDFVAVINGSRLYVLNRYNGDLLLETELSGSPGAGPALSTKRVYVPLVDGLIVAYPLTSPDDAKQPSTTADQDETDEQIKTSEEARQRNLRLESKTTQPLFCQSFGRALVQPVIGRETSVEENVVWPTDRGYLNLGRIDRQSANQLLLKYRLHTGAAIVGRSAYYPPDPEDAGDSGLIVSASRDGYVYAFREKDGELLWRFSIGEPIVESPAVIEGRVYIPSQLGGMHCLNIKTGKELWFAPELLRFVAAGANRIYAADRFGRLMAIDAQSGARLDSINTENATIKLQNDDTDRIYLADEKGLIQCLHEAELAEPLVHDKQRKLVAVTEGMPAIKQTGIDEVEKSGKKEEPAPKEVAAKTDRDNVAEDSDAKEQENPVKKKEANPFDVGDDKPDQVDKDVGKNKDKKEEAPIGFGF